MLHKKNSSKTQQLIILEYLLMDIKMISNFMFLKEESNILCLAGTVDKKLAVIFQQLISHQTLTSPFYFLSSFLSPSNFPFFFSSFADLRPTTNRQEEVMEAVVHFALMHLTVTK